MNLLEEDVKLKGNEKNKKSPKIILIAIVLIFLIIIAIVSYLTYIKSNMLQLTLDGESNEKLKQMLVFEEDGTIYMPIKESAKYFGYDGYNGEYNNVSEEPSKCYVQCENEIVNFSLGTNKISKLDISGSSNNVYEYIYVKKPVKAMNGVLYATAETMEEALNMSFQYDQEKNSITIFTMPYLIQFYESKILDYGYSKLSDDFSNRKAILENILIVKKEDGTKYGVIDVQGNVILEPKYDNITYIHKTGDFLVESNQKFGIISSMRETKVSIIYSSIEILDSESGLYVVKNEKNKYGVIDSNGNIKIYIENDDIGIDISKFKENNIKSQYLLVDNLIPAKKDGYWGLYDKNGNQVVDYEYDSFGYIASNNKNTYNLLVIPNYNVLVACKDKKYTLINSSGEKLFSPIADDIYMTITSEEKHYYINVNNRQIDAEAYLDKKGIATKTKTENESNNEQSNTNQTNVNQTNENRTSQNQSSQNESNTNRTNTNQSGNSNNQNS